MGIKVYIDNAPRSYRQRVEKEFTAVSGCKKADIIIATNTVSPDWDYSKVVLVLKESPITGHRRWLYDNKDKFHTVFTHNPAGENELAFTDSPEVFPWGPALKEDVRPKVDLRANRRIYYSASRKDRYAKMPDYPGTVNMYAVRNKIMYDLITHSEGVGYGRGWGHEKIKLGKCGALMEGKVKPAMTARQYKYQDIVEADPAFMLCVENCIQSNLITDHFHDGYNAGRLVLYLGEPDIEKHVPSECYVDLRPLYDGKALDMGGVVEIARSMGQAEYDRIRESANEWRRAIVGKHEQEKAKMLETLIERIKQ